MNAYFAEHGAYPNKYRKGVFRADPAVARQESLIADYNSAASRALQSFSDDNDESVGDDESNVDGSNGDDERDGNDEHGGDENAGGISYDDMRGRMIFPNFSNDLPAIPDIRKSYYQLEQERLNGGQRPSYFSRAEWNKPIPESFQYVSQDDSSESEEDSDDEEYRARGAKARELKLVEASKVTHES